jgi:Carboxypeptidase regulatory-like domain
MTHRFVRLALAWVLVGIGSTVAYGQGGSTTAPLSGVVVDASGAHIPGASVTVKNEATGSTYQAVSNDKGSFTVPALQAGTYAVTVSLAGFKQVVIRGVKVLAATPTAVNATLEVGGMEETVTVESGGAPLVQSQSTAISTTVEVAQINNLPVQSRNALDFLTGLPGVLTAGGARDSIVSGLDQSAINITIDGMSVQDNYLKTTDGYFARLSPRLDAVEEVTMTTVGGGAETSGQGGVQIRFISRQGTNAYHGSVYEYFRRDWLNANTWFNNRDLPPDPATGKAPIAKLKFDNYGVRFGGPIRIPGVFDGRNRAFFFINYEELRQPADVSRQRTILSPSAQQGVFQYSTAGGVRTVNLLQLAGANGQTATIDPTIAKLLADIRNSTQGGGVADLADPLVQRFSYQSDFSNITRYPHVRLDVQLTQKHRLTATYTLNKLLSDPDTLNNRDAAFPGFPIHGVQDSKRFAYQGALRSTLNANLVNDLRFFGATGGATLFSTEIDPSMWSGSLANQGGFHLNMNTSCCGTGQLLTNPTQGTTNAGAANNAGQAITSREASTKVAHDSLTWIKGSHNLNFGVEFTQADVWLNNQSLVPAIDFGIATGDPAEALFNTTNFPGASTAVLNNARGLYAILTGRVLAMRGNARLDENTGDYQYLGPSTARGRMRELDFFAQDSWRPSSNLTLNYGLRYVLQLPLYPTNDSYSTATLADVWGVSGVGNLFKPGVLNGKKPEFVPYPAGQRAYNIDWNNFAPNVGATWRPNLGDGFLRKMFGSEPVFRAGFAMAYSRNGMSDFTDVFGANPGIAIDVNRNQDLGNLGAVPLLLRDTARLTPPPFQSSRPTTDVITGDVSIFDPDLKIPYVQSWSAGFQRQIGKTMAFEARYIGTRGRQLWTDYNVNEANIVENGFLDEFRLAQQNLFANISAGRGSTFRYFGPGSGTSPLPIYLAYFSGIPMGRAGDPSLYTSALFGSTNFTNPLARFNPQPFTPAGVNSNTGLDGDPTRRANARTAGLPVNFFRANPDLMGGAFIRGNGGGTSYNAVELELRRNWSHGLYFRTSYTFGKTYEQQRFGMRYPFEKRLNAGNEGGVAHAFKVYGIWELPFGKNKRFAGNASGVLDRIIGGWQFAGTARVQSGRILDFGNVRLMGMSRKEFQKSFKLRFDDAGKAVYMLPQDIVDNTIKAFGTSATSPTGYGSLGAPTGRYLAPANGPDCIELVDSTLFVQGTTTGAAQFGYNYGPGNCGEGSLAVTGPMFWTTDLSLVKRIPLKGQVTLDFRAELLNALNHPSFAPVTGGGGLVGFDGRAGTGAGGYASSGSYLVVNSNDYAPRIAQMVLRLTF